MKRVLLAGGGHTHALALLALADEPLAGAQVTLISDSTHLIYSGMLPGLVAGRYETRDVEIDVARLAARCGARFVRGDIVSVNPELREVTLQDRTKVAYDVLSLNVGARPDPSGVPGADAWAVPTKPSTRLLDALRRPAAPTDVAVVGAGVAGVELAFALRARLGVSVPVTLIERSETVMPTFAARIRRRVTTELLAKGIELRLRADIVGVERGRVTLAAGRTVGAGLLIWATAARPPSWLGAAGFAVRDDGSLRVASTLRSLSHPEVFAVGDAAAIEGLDVPKSGVYAVRQAPVLVANLRAAVSGLPLTSYNPQKRALTLLDTGDGGAIFVRGPLVAKGRWAFRLKDRIDRGFVARFAAVPA